MTVSTARRHGFSIFPSDINIKSANNAVTPVVGVTDELPIDIHGHYCSISFIVLDHDDHELLLGLDRFTIQIITITQDITSNLNPSSTTSQQIQPQSPTLIGIRKFFCDSPQPHSQINIDCLFNSTFHETHPNKSTRWNPSTGRGKPLCNNF